MKKLKILLVICLSAALFSCSSDDSSINDDSNNANLLGTWNLTSIDYSLTYSKETSNGPTVYSSTVGVGRDLFQTKTFTENPDELLSQGSLLIDMITTTANGETRHTGIGTASTGNIYNWSLNGDQLTVNGENGAVINNYTITLLDENSLNYYYSDTSQFEQNGVTHTKVLTETYTFSK